MTDDIVNRLRKKYAGQLPICLEAADEIERLEHACDYYHKMCSMIADKNFTANEEIDRLRKEVAYLKTPCPRCDYEDSNE